MGNSDFASQDCLTITVIFPAFCVLLNNKILHSVLKITKPSLQTTRREREMNGLWFQDTLDASKDCL